MTRLIGRVRRDEAGMTLPELIVTMGLLTVVGAILMSFLFSMMTTTSRALGDSETEKQIELTLRPVTQLIRSATTIAAAYPSSGTCVTGSYPTGYANCMSFTVSRPVQNQLSCPKSIVTLGLNGGVIRMDRTDYALVNSACVVTRNTQGYPLLRGVSNGTTPLFMYFDRFGNQLNPNASGQTTGPFVAAATVRISVNAKYKTNAPTLTYTSDLAVRNNR